MIQGDVAKFLSAMGAREGDRRLTDALALIGGEYETSNYVDDGVESKYLVSKAHGVDFLLEDGALRSIFFHARSSAGQKMYDGWSSLVDGIGPDMSQADVVNALGAPKRSTGVFAIYQADPGFIRFVFSGGKIKTVVAQQFDLFDTGDQPNIGEIVSHEEAEGEAAPHVAGELTVFMNAVGSAIYSPEHLAVTVLAGPAMETHEDQRADATWVYQEFPKTGVTLQFKNDLLAGALVLLAGPNAYPTPDRLIDGVPLPSSRESIETALGTPRMESDNQAFYLLGDKYVAFDFEAGLSTVVTVIEPGVEV